MKTILFSALILIGATNTLAASFDCTISPQNDAQTLRDCNLGPIKLFHDKSEAGLRIQGREHLFSNSGEGSRYYLVYGKSSYRLGQYNLANILLSSEILSSHAGQMNLTFDHNDEDTFEVKYTCKPQSPWL